MSREGAYRLRERRDGALFAARWDQILRQPFSPPTATAASRHESHNAGSIGERRRFRLAASMS